MKRLIPKAKLEWKEPKAIRKTRDQMDKESLSPWAKPSAALCCSAFLSAQVLDRIAAALEGGPFKGSRNVGLSDGRKAAVAASRTYFSWKGLVILATCCRSTHQ